MQHKTFFGLEPSVHSSELNSYFSSGTTSSADPTTQRSPLTDTPVTSGTNVFQFLLKHFKLYFAGPGIEGSAQIAALVISLVVLFLLASVLFLVLRRRKKQRDTKETEDEDENPVYGMYEFADGRNIDEGRSEFVDDNENYGLQETVQLFVECVFQVEIKP